MAKEEKCLVTTEEEKAFIIYSPPPQKKCFFVPCLQTPLLWTATRKIYSILTFSDDQYSTERLKYLPAKMRVYNIIMASYRYYGWSAKININRKERQNLGV